MAKNPKIKTRVVHSQTKSAWNVVSEILGGKYKIARVPYLTISNEELSERNRVEALEHANFISHCFNNSGSKRPDIEAFRKHIENMSDEKFDKIVSEIEAASDSEFR